MPKLLLRGALLLICSASTCLFGADPEPDLFVVETVAFNNKVVTKQGLVKTTARVSLLEPMPSDCPFTECWGSFVWPTGVSAYSGEDGCTIEKIDDYNLKIVLADKFNETHPRGYYRFESLSLRASCNNYANGYEGPRSRFLLNP